MEEVVGKKYLKLITRLKDLGSVAVAFSGGVDSTFLVYAAREALGKNVTAYTVHTPYIPQWEVDEAKAWISGIGVRHEIITLDIPVNIKNNPPDRCYLCKKKLFSLLREEMSKHDIPYLLEGTNKDDEGHYRPGMKALTELKVLSPLREIGFTKKEIREASKALGLSTFDKPAYACLLTRIPYNTAVTADELERIGQGESALFSLGFAGARLRSHGDLARIELQEQHFGLIHDEKMRMAVAGALKEAGYRFVCIDLEGYRMGSYDQTIERKDNI